MIQQGLFKEYLDPIKLKEGKQKCPCCNRLMKAYHKTLDDRLVDLAYEILGFLMGNIKLNFNPREVWGNDLNGHEKILDFQKLRYWGIIEKTGRSGWWFITKLGDEFLKHHTGVVRDCWPFNGEVILWGDDVVFAKYPDERWQKEKSDWTLDYLPVNYKTTFELQNNILK